MQAKEHWERFYGSKPVEALSWYQAHAERSLRLIGATGAALGAAIIDVGGGASTLVDDLLDRGYSALTVLDVSAIALAAARRRLGPRAAVVRWIEADIRDAPLPSQAFEVWHDRAVFHFLTEAEDRRAYVAQARRAVKAGGHVILASFAEDGPSRCSGLPVMRYSPAALQTEFGPGFTLLRHEREAHHTPAGVVQSFI